jgi:hypothetical protein
MKKYTALVVFFLVITFDTAFTQPNDLYGYLTKNSEEYNSDTLHVFFYRHWYEDNSHEVIRFKGNEIEEQYAEKLVAKYFFEAPLFILGYFDITPNQKGFLIRHMGMYEPNQISLIIEDSTGNLSEPIKIARSGGDGAWIYEVDSWLFDINKDGSKDIFTWRKEEWENEQTEKWENKDIYTFYLWSNGKYNLDESIKINTSEFNHYKWQAN